MNKGSSALFMKINQPMNFTYLPFSVCLYSTLAKFDIAPTAYVLTGQPEGRVEDRLGKKDFIVGRRFLVRKHKMKNEIK